MIAHRTPRNTSSMAMALRASLRYYSPEKDRERVRRKPQPPHVYFANLRLDWGSLLDFDKTFGVLLREHWRLTPATEAILEKAPNLSAAEREQWATSQQKHEIAVYESDVQLAKEMQRLLQGAWRGDQTSIELLQFGAKHYAQQQAYGPIQIKPVPTSGGVDIYAHDLWTYIRIAFLADQKRARVCANPDCAAPYFLAKRKDTKLCGESECTAWAQRQWSLDWWNKRGDKLRRQDKAKVKRKAKR